MFLTLLILIWLLNLALATLTPDRLRRPVSIAMPLLAAGLFFWQAPLMVPWQRLVITTFGLLQLIKAVILLRIYRREQIGSFATTGLLAYFSVWPGMDPEPLRKRQIPVDENGSRFVRGLKFFLAGIALAVATAIWQPELGMLSGWTGLFSLLLIIHFGYSEILTTLMRLTGWNLGPLFNEPFKSNSLRDFWSRRWNLAFVEMDRILFVPGLKRLFGIRTAVFLVFVISGLLHDLCISGSAGAGWGLPTLYFLLHGSAVLLETRLLGRNTSPTLTRIWTWLWILLPLPLLFTEPFRAAFIMPFFQWLHAIITAHNWEWYLSVALWLGGLGHFCTFGAGLQVPFRLNWFEELERVSPFNRKIFLNYAGYVGLMIAAFGTGTFLLHDEMMRGDRAAAFLCAVITLFWALRLLVDYLWFGDKDWPEGPLFVIGHACLNMLFVFLTVTYCAVFLHAFF